LSLSFWRRVWQSGSRLRRQSVHPRLEQLEDRTTPSAPDIITLASFGGSSGQPLGGLVMDGTGNLYGEWTGLGLRACLESPLSVPVAVG
jgi:hypothetical protein